MLPALLATVLFAVSTISGRRNVRLLGSAAANFWRQLFAVVVLAAGLRRLVGPGRLRATIFALLAGQVTAWILTATLPTPDAWRGLVDVVVAVGLVLVAVLSQPAFEEQR